MDSCTITREDTIASATSDRLCWRINTPNERDVLTLTQKLGIPDIIARILVSRGITLETAPAFLHPTLRDLMPDPFHLKDMEQAVVRTIDAIKNNEKIAFFGDYDVDGATSTSVLKRYFAMLGVDSYIYIPDRIKEGYGPNEAAMQQLKEQGYDLIITVDCGTAAFEPLALAKDIGLDVVVLDHHLSGEALPEAIAIVNPNRLDESSPYTYLAAVGVAFLFAIAITSSLRKEGWFAEKQEPNLLSLLDIVALGTVCDVVPLKGLNRALVSQGLKIMARRTNLGLTVLSDIAGMQEAPNSYHLGFLLGPRINAGGRVGESSLGAQLLTTENYETALTVANKLDAYNAERKVIEANVQEEAIRQAETYPEDTPLLVVKGEDWHPGVIGIVAGRLKEQFHKPVAVITMEDGVGKASARSVTGIDFGRMVVNAKLEGLLVAGGGHAMAAGFTVEEEKIEALKAFFNAQCLEQIPDEGLTHELKCEGFLSARGITLELVEQLDQLSPFGAENPEPRFVISDAVLTKVWPMGKDHIQCIISSESAASSLRGVAFRCRDTELETVLMNGLGRHLHLAGKIRLNTWQGRKRVDFHIEDAALPA